MIFVTVGTHEQQFNRLIQEIDRLIEAKLITEEVFIQRGIQSTSPQKCSSAESIIYDQILENMKKARITITHGGPGSIMLSLSFGKIPIVVPRQAKYKEHVDNHQIDFTRRLERQKKIIAVYEIAMLGEKIAHYNTLCQDLMTHEIPSSIKNLKDNLTRYCMSLIRDGEFLARP